jgi:NAD(P)-dependent dehydrogenase (short-subunit alcohol dehydrogenase family)
MDLSLRNKKVFVSGSSRGIGLCIARKFIEEGADVVINSRNSDELTAATRFLGNCNSIAGDLSNPAVALATITKAAEILGGIDIVVCNVGSGSSVPPGQETYNEWLRVFDVNFFSATNLIEASRRFLGKSQGSIVCISSICGIETVPGAPVTYSVAKSALNTYVKSMSVPLALEGIRINSVAPGNINFEGSVWSKKIAQDPDSVKDMLEKNVPLREFGSPDDVAHIVIWLASDVAKFVTGTIFIADGGQTRS